MVSPRPLVVGARDVRQPGESLARADREVVRRGDPQPFASGYSYEPGDAYRSYYGSDELWFPGLDTPDVLARKSEALTVTRGGQALAVSVEELQAQGPTLVDLAEDWIVAVPTSAGGRLYLGDGERPVAPGGPGGDRGAARAARRAAPARATRNRCGSRGTRGTPRPASGPRSRRVAAEPQIRDGAATRPGITGG